MDYLASYSSPLGAITMASDGTALCGLWFEGQKHFAEAVDKQQRKQLSLIARHAADGTSADQNESQEQLALFDQAHLWLDVYFAGQVPDFTPALSLRGTAFRKAVWKTLLTIPYGTTVTYGQIAAELIEQQGLAHMSAQAVGGAVGHNPISLIVPCHRVVAAKGALGGYAGGTWRKTRLLELEKVSLQKGPHALNSPSSH